MALVTANSVAVLSGTINRPQRGVWTADLVIDQPDGSGFDVGTQVTVSIDGGPTLIGVVAPNRSGSFLDSVHVRVIGGAGGLTKTATARAYAQPGAFVRDVVNGLVADSGETLAATTDAGFLSTNLTSWSVSADKVSRGLSTLINFVDDSLNWRILDDGTLWIGSESWPTVQQPDAVSLSFDPTNNSYDVGEDAPSIAPGTNVPGIGNVGRVEHLIEPDRIRTVVYVASDELRGFNAHIKKIVSSELSRRGFDYFALYNCKVISQNGNTVDVQPVETSLPGLSRVSLRHGLPAVSVTVAPGCFVLLGWDGGNPSAPYACLWGGGETLAALSIGTAPDAVITKIDYTALLQAISLATYVNAAGITTPISFVPPTSYGSTSIKVQR